MPQITPLSWTPISKIPPLEFKKDDIVLMIENINASFIILSITIILFSIDFFLFPLVVLVISCNFLISRSSSIMANIDDLNSNADDSPDFIKTPIEKSFFCCIDDENDGDDCFNEDVNRVYI